MNTDALTTYRRQALSNVPPFYCEPMRQRIPGRRYLSPFGWCVLACFTFWFAIGALLAQVMKWL
jgi:hypothetical protein